MAAKLKGNLTVLKRQLHSEKNKNW